MRSEPGNASPLEAGRSGLRHAGRPSVLGIAALSVVVTTVLLLANSSASATTGRPARTATGSRSVGAGPAGPVDPSTPAWRVVFVSPSVQLVGLHVFGPQAVWVAGSDGRLHAWDGTGWSMQHPDDDTSAVTAVDPRDAWAASDDGIRHWDGVRWSLVSRDGGVRAIAAADRNHAWAVDTRGLLEWNGHAWASGPMPAGVVLGSVAATDATHAWAVGTAPNGRGEAVNWNGSAWLETRLPQPLSAISAPDPAHAWAVSPDGGVFTWDGTGWHESAELHLDLAAITGDHAGDLWAAARTGEVLAFRDARWTIVYRAPTALREIAALDARHVWAIGFDTVYATLPSDEPSPWYGTGR